MRKLLAAAGRASGELAPVLALALALPFAAPATIAAQEVTSVVFEGAETFHHDSLRAAIVNRATGCRDPLFRFLAVCLLGFARDRHELQRTELDADALRLRLYYYERGFRAASVDARVDSVAPGAVRLVFRVAEREPVRVRSLTFPGAAPEHRALLDALPLRTGEPLNLMLYEATRDTVRARLRNRGYARADVLVGYAIAADSPYVARVEYELLPGEPARFGPVHVLGVQRVDTALVRRVLAFEPGDPYRESALLQSRRNLFALELFRHADVRERLDAGGDTTVPVIVQVSEGTTQRVRVGAGLNSADCLNAESRWLSRNFFGGARRMELRARLANVLAEQVGGFPCAGAGSGIYDDLTGSIALDFAQPWFFGPAHSVGAGLFAERQSVTDVFVRTARGAQVSLLRAPGERSTFTLSYRPALTELDAADDVFCANFVFCDASDIRVLREPHWLAPVTLAFVRDRSNAVFAPTRGYILRLEAENASTLSGSEFSYTRLLGELSVYRDVGGGAVLAARLRPGWARAGDGDGLGLHPQKRFFAGGPNSVRGFAQYRLGPKVLSVDAATLLADTTGGRAPCAPAGINDGSCDAQGVADALFDVRPVGGNALLEGNVELRLPLAFRRVGAAAFLDFGQVWSDAGAAHPADVVFTPGLGVRIFSPAGPIRVDLGYNAGGAERVPVITTEVDEAGNRTGRLRTLDQPVDWQRDDSLLDRLQLHFSIGQAF